MSKKFFIAWIVIFIAWMAGSFVVHGALLGGDYTKLQGTLFRAPADSQQYFHFMILAHVIMAGAFAGSMRAAPRPSHGWRRACASASPLC